MKSNPKHVFVIIQTPRVGFIRVVKAREASAVCVGGGAPVEKVL